MGNKIAYFDLDGTVYDLYNMENWLERIQKEDPNVFLDGNAIYSKPQMEIMAETLQKAGYEIGVITWLPMNASVEYMIDCISTKRQWVKENMPFVDGRDFHALPYGTPKQNARIKKRREMLLFDDNNEVREMWNTPKQRKSIDANEHLLDIIVNL